MTYGQLKWRLVKAYPGIDLTLIEGWISDVYGDILTEQPWQRLSVEAVLQTAAPYSTGSVALAEGSPSVTGTGTTFTAAMTGMAFRVTGRSETYEFTYVSATSGTLDRGYEGATDTGIGFKIFQYVYPLPADCRLLEDNAFSPMVRKDRSQLDFSDSARSTFGTPKFWASYMDDGSTPPRMQVELDPVPDTAASLPFSYTADVSLPAQSAAFLAWMSPTALIEGVNACVKRHLKDYVGAEMHAREADKALKGMRRTEAHGMAPARMQMDSYYTRHRSRRFCR